MSRAIATLSISCLLLIGAFKLTSNQLKADQTSIPQETLRSHPPGVFALTGAKVIVSPEVTLDSATVVVRDGKIEAVGDLKVPDDAKEISLTGKTIYPGFIDSYSEQTVNSDRLNGSARYWNSQVTSQLSMADQLVPGEDLGTLRKQGFVAQLVAPAEGVVRGTSALISTSGGEANTIC